MRNGLRCLNLLAIIIIHSNSDIEESWCWWRTLSVSYCFIGLVKWSSQPIALTSYPPVYGRDGQRLMLFINIYAQVQQAFQRLMNGKREESTNRQWISRSRVWWIFGFCPEASRVLSHCLIESVPTANLAIRLILPEMTRHQRSDPVPLSQVRLLPSLPLLPPSSPWIRVRTGPYPISLL